MLARILTNTLRSTAFTSIESHPMIHEGVVMVHLGLAGLGALIVTMHLGLVTVDSDYWLGLGGYYFLDVSRSKPSPVRK